MPCLSTLSSLFGATRVACCTFNSIWIGNSGQGLHNRRLLDSYYLLPADSV